MIGSVEERAEYKKTMGPYVIGCIMVFAISNLLTLIYNIVINMQMWYNIKNVVFKVLIAI